MRLGLGVPISWVFSFSLRKWSSGNKVWIRAGSTSPLFRLDANRTQGIIPTQSFQIQAWWAFDSLVRVLLTSQSTNMLGWWWDLHQSLFWTQEPWGSLSAWAFQNAHRSRFIDESPGKRTGTPMPCTNLETISTIEYWLRLSWLIKYSKSKARSQVPLIGNMINPWTTLHKRMVWSFGVDRAYAGLSRHSIASYGRTNREFL